MIGSAYLTPGSSMMMLIWPVKRLDLPTCHLNVYLVDLREDQGGLIEEGVFLQFQTAHDGHRASAAHGHAGGVGLCIAILLGRSGVAGGLAEGLNNILNAGRIGIRNSQGDAVFARRQDAQIEPPSRVRLSDGHHLCVSVIGVGRASFLFHLHVNAWNALLVACLPPSYLKLRSCACAAVKDRPMTPRAKSERVKDLILL